MRDIISYDSIFEAKPESRKDLRALARDVRLLLGINPCQLYIDITRVLEEMEKFQYIKIQNGKQNVLPVNY